MSDVDNDGERQLSEVLWDLHFATSRIVNGVVRGVYKFSTKDVIHLEYEKSPKKENHKQGQKVKRRPVRGSQKATEQNPLLCRSATFQRLLLQARVLWDSMNLRGKASVT